ncbi:MAG: TerC family protein [Herbaspirillum sp.]
MDLLLTLNWTAVGQIILIDILLGGDNAIVIALACRNLPENLRLKGILWGTAGAVVLRVALIAFAVTMLEMPFIKLAGGLLLLWIGIKLLSDNERDHTQVAASDQLWGAVKTIVVADLAMSIDNVIAVASAAEQAADEHKLLLVVFGILVSIPIIVWGSTLVLKLMTRFPIIVTFGAALLGYLAGGMIFSDAASGPWLKMHVPLLDITLPNLGLRWNLPELLGAILVVSVGTYLAHRVRTPKTTLKSEKGHS